MIFALIIMSYVIRMGADGSKPSGTNGQMPSEKTQLERNTEEKDKKVITQIPCTLKNEKKCTLGKIDIFPIMKDYAGFANSCIDKLSEEQYKAIFTTFYRNAFVVFVFNSIIPGMYTIYWRASWMRYFGSFTHLSTVNKEDFHKIVNDPDFGINGDRSYTKLVEIMKKKDGIRKDTKLTEYLEEKEKYKNKIVYFIGESPTAWNREQTIASWRSAKRDHTREVVVGTLHKLRDICYKTLQTDINAEDIILPTKNHNMAVGTLSNNNNKKSTNNSNRPPVVFHHPSGISSNINKNTHQNANTNSSLPQQLYPPRGNQQTAGRKRTKRHTKKR